jgi:periplasmic divalent cation tolerance protein
MFIAWTTVATRAEAERLAAGAVAARLAACVQIDGPITSHYFWQGKTERSEEFRLTFKCLPAQLAALEAQVLAAHPYATPQWLVVRAERVAEKYLSWAGADLHSPPL